MFQRLLVCTELTDGLQRLVNFVPSLAAAGVKQLMFLHVIPLPDDRVMPYLDEEKAQAARDRLTAHLDGPEGVEVKVEVQWGRPAEQILKMTKTYQPDLILLGSATQSLLSEKLFGSTSMNLCQRLTVPVLVFRPQLLCTYREAELELRCRHLFDHLLIPYDGSRAADHTIERLKQIVPDRSPESARACTLCWVIEVGGRQAAILKQSQTEEAHEKLQVVKAELEALHFRVAVELRFGEPILEVLESGNANDISAIVLSSDRLGKLVEWSSPSFAAELLRRSWHPVIYIPPDR